jgi:hypothetical protein
MSEREARGLHVSAQAASDKGCKTGQRRESCNRSMERIAGRGGWKNAGQGWEGIKEQ